MRLLAPLHSPAGSGGDTTIRRIAGHLAAAGHSVQLVPAPGDPAELARLAKTQDVDALLGTHLYLSGQLFLETELPCVLVLGGTDLNEFVLEPEYLTVMTGIVERAAALVAFNDDFLHRCHSLWPETAGRLHRIPQAVHTQPSGYSVRDRLGLTAEDHLLLLPSGLRPVKDPLYLIDQVHRWHEQDPRVHLAIAGVTYEPEYRDIVLRRCAAGGGVHWLGALPRADLHAAMLDATAVLNTSLSECSPNAVLEAMDLGVPVLVRDIPGNTCLVVDEVTGLVCATPEDFRDGAARLMADPALAARLGRRGQDWVRRAHRLDAERAAYLEVFARIGPVSDTRVGDRQVLVDGMELWVETFGDPAHDAVVLIAGAGASMLAWDTGFCERLAAAGRYVVRYDHRDTGRSAGCPPGAPGYTERDLVGDALGLLDVLGIALADVVGASMGGMIAQRIAIEHPSRVRSLTLLSSSPGGDGLPGAALPFRIALDDLDVPDWSDQASVVEYLVAVDRLLAGTGRPFDDRLPRQRAGRVFERSDGRLASAANHQLVETAELWRHRLPGIAAPTLVVHGTADPLYPVAHANALAREIPNSTLLLLDGAGHELAAADTERVLAALLRHLS